MATVARRVLISGMGGELGSRVAVLLEGEPWVARIEGIDIDPPRVRLRRAHFHRIEPRDRRRTVELVRTFDPHVALHLGVYEPNARANPRSAVERTKAAAVSVLGAVAECPSLEAIVVRSGVEVYGRRRGSCTRPDEQVAPEPTSPFGRSLRDVELIGVEAAEASGVPATLLRLAPVVGPHVPSPLGRYLRLAVVPVSLLADPSFSLLHIDDAARAIVHAARARWSGPVNVVAQGAVTASQAVRLGGRVPLPLLGPGWPIARRYAAAVGAPIPDHVIELVHRGRTADGALAAHAIGFEPVSTTLDVVKALYQWATVTHLRPAAAVA
jgi:UDP-glucose 4-epimerase